LLTNEIVGVFIVTDFEIVVGRQLTERLLWGEVCANSLNSNGILRFLKNKMSIFGDAGVFLRVGKNQR
jgi:hypothetical protein